MSSPISLAEYFALEAGDYLERLHAMLEQPAPPAAEELVRYTRALRGSALMANQGLVARAAAGLEVLAKAYREGRRAWDSDARRAGSAPRSRPSAGWSVRSPSGPMPTWPGPNDWPRSWKVRPAFSPARSSALLPPPPGPRQGPTAGVRAFVAREGALTASALDRAARALRTSPTAMEPLYAVLRRLQSLRGPAPP